MIAKLQQSCWKRQTFHSKKSKICIDFISDICLVECVKQFLANRNLCLALEVDKALVVHILDAEVQVATIFGRSGHEWCDDLGLLQLVVVDVNENIVHNLALDIFEQRDGLDIELNVAIEPLLISAAHHDWGSHDAILVIVDEVLAEEHEFI